MTQFMKEYDENKSQKRECANAISKTHSPIYLFYNSLLIKRNIRTKKQN